MKVSFLNIINSSKQIILNPKLFWIEKKEDLKSQSKLLLGYLLPLIIVVAVAKFFGEFLRSSDFYMETALLKMLRVIVLFLLQYFISVFFTNKLIKTFGGEKNIDISRNIVVFSLTPFLLVSIVTGLFPFLYVIEILGLYSFYIFWIGIKELLIFPENKQLKFTILTVVVNFIIFSFLSISLSKLMNFFY